MALQVAHAVVHAQAAARRRRRWLSLRARAWAIALGYAALATLWIWTSDHALEAMVGDPATRAAWSVWKGVAFVALTAALLLLLMVRVFGSIERGYLALAAREAEIERINRMLAALSHVNQAIAWEKSRESLFARVSRVLVDDGGFRRAWIGAREGDEIGLVALAAAPARAGEGETPDAAAADLCLRQGRPLVLNRLQDASEPWAAGAHALGLRAVAAFPIGQPGSLEGCVVVWSDSEGVFRDQVAALLVEASRDLSSALDGFRREEARRLAQERMDHESAFSAAMIESMPGVVYFYDEHGRFLRWNRNFLDVTGYTATELAAMGPLDFFGAAERPLVQARIEEVFERGHSSVEAGFLTRDGRAIPHLFTGRKVLFEGQPCLVGMGIDVTELRRAEQALRELNETLELQVRERTAELSAALVRAESADRLKSAFLATMSHELRTPLNAIIGFTSIVLRGMAGPVNEEQVKQLGMVRASARHLLELINDVLDLSKIEAGQLEVRFAPFDAAESIRRVVGLVEPMAHQKGLALTCRVEPGVAEIVSDRRRFEQILLNLLNNAVKFTDRGGVELAAGREDGGDGEDGVGAGVLRIRVTDTGIGIKPQDLHTLFQPFRQIDSGIARQHEGTGLGLTICRRLAGLMDGAITVKSEWEQGSVFTLTLPMERQT